jgi:hypothetical protein
MKHGQDDRQKPEQELSGYEQHAVTRVSRMERQGAPS